MRKSKPRPLSPDAVENGLKLSWLLHIHGHYQRRFKLLGQWADVGFRLFVEVGDGEIGAKGPELGGTAIGDAAIIAIPTTKPRLPLAYRRYACLDPKLGPRDR